MSSSTREAPILPPLALINVYVIPPPIIRLSTLSSRFSITIILSDTLAPPIIAVKGFSGRCSTLSILFNSLTIRYPNIFSSGKNFAIIVVDACALWAVPKASFTYTSARSASFLANDSSPLFSSLWNLRFSSRRTSPGLSSFTILDVSSPIQSFANLTSVSSNSERRGIIFLRENFFSYSPFGRPRWDIKIVAPPEERIFFIVGNAALIRVSSATSSFSFIGTLKSTLIIAFFPVKS